MSDLELSSPPSATLQHIAAPHAYAPYHATTGDYRNSFNGHLQMARQNAYMQSLMQRIATNQASQQERDIFDQHVREAGALPRLQQTVWQNAPAVQSQPVMQPSHPPPTIHSQHDYEMQLRLLEAQNKRRLQVAREQQENTSHASGGNSSTGGNHAQAASFADIEAARFPRATRRNAEKYAKPFCNFLTNNPTVFHAVAALKEQLKDEDFVELSERDEWKVKPAGKYFVQRNSSSLIAFVVGVNYKAGNGAAILAGHVDALTAKLKPISQVPNRAGFVQLGVAPYAGALNNTWWDRDLGIGGRVLIKEGDKIVEKLVKLDWPIARIPTLAPHFGAPSQGPFNLETQAIPIIGLEDTTTSAPDVEPDESFRQPSFIGHSVADDRADSFVSTQPPALVKAIGNALGLRTDTYSTIVNWELELFDVQPATLGGLSREFIYAGRIDDKLCSWAALQALIEGSRTDTDKSSVIKMVGLFDDEEIGSLLRQGARGNFLPATMDRAVSSLAGSDHTSGLIGQTFANSFLLSSDVTHAVNPNFLDAYLQNHAPHLNVGVAISADSSGHMCFDAVSAAILKRCADKVGAKLQIFHARNDSGSRGGGGSTIGPMLSAMTGIRAIDAGIPQLSMHSIRATTGALDPGLGVIMFTGFLNGFEEVDREFRL